MRSILLTTMVGWLARVLAIALNVISMPIVLHGLGSTRFGIMLISLSIGSWIGLGNAGFGRVVAIVTARYHQRSPAFVASAVSHLLMVSARFYVALFVAFAAGFLILAPNIDLGADGAGYVHEFTCGTVGVLLAMAAWFFLSIFEGVDAGYHQLFRLYRIQAVTYALTLLLMFTAFKARPSLLFATLLLGSGGLVGNLIHAVDVWRRRRNLFRSRGAPRRLLARSVLYNSLDFTVISVAISIIFQFTTGMVGLLVGPDEIINLGVFMRIMNSVGAIIMTVTFPMSNLIAGRLAHRDYTGATKAALWTGGGLLISIALAAVAFDAIGERLLSLWLKQPVSYDPAFKLFAALLIFLTGLYAYSTGVAVGYGNLRAVARIHAVVALSALPLAYICFHNLGQTGILLAIDIILLGSATACLATVSGANGVRIRSRLSSGALFGRAGRRNISRSAP